MHIVGAQSSFPWAVSNLTLALSARNRHAGAAGDAAVLPDIAHEHHAAKDCYTPRPAVSREIGGLYSPRHTNDVCTGEAEAIGSDNREYEGQKHPNFEINRKNMLNPQNPYAPKADQNSWLVDILA